MRHATRRARRADPAPLARERDHELVAAHLTADAREAVGQHAAPQVLGELALDVARQAAAIGVLQLRQHRLRVLRHELVQHRALWRASLVAAERLSGRASRAFVDTSREHARAL